MKRRLFTILAAISLMLSFTSILLWLPIGLRRIGITYETNSPHIQYAVMRLEDAVILRRFTVPWRAESRWEVWHQNLGIWRDPLDNADAGTSDGRARNTRVWSCGRLALYTFTYLYSSRSGESPYELKETSVVIPYWQLFLLFALLPLWLLRLRIRDRRQHDRATKGLCLKCGYDLRASPDRCPECGTNPQSKDTAQLLA